MKKISKFLVFFLLLFLLPLNVSAAGEDRIRPSLLLEQREALTEAIYAYFTGLAGSDSPAVPSFDANQAYEIEFNHEYVVEAVRKKGSFSALKGENAQIRVPTGSGDIHLQWKDGKFTVLGVSSSASGKRKTFSWEVMEKLFREAGMLESSADYPYRLDTRIVRNNLYGAVFASVYCDGQEYVVVFDSMLDEAGIENEKLYTADELIGKMDAYYVEKTTVAAVVNAWLHGDVLRAGYAVRGESRPLRLQRLLCLIIAVILFVSVVIVLPVRAIRKRKARRKQEE